MKPKRQMLKDRNHVLSTFTVERARKYGDLVGHLLGQVDSLYRFNWVLEYENKRKTD